MKVKLIDTDTQRERERGYLGPKGRETRKFELRPWRQRGAV